MLINHHQLTAINLSSIEILRTAVDEERLLIPLSTVLLLLHRTKTFEFSRLIHQMTSAKGTNQVNCRRCITFPTFKRQKIGYQKFHRKLECVQLE